MKAYIVTLFPEILEGFLNTALIGRARDQGILEARTVPLREFSTDRHRATDDAPYGGGGGMVMTCQPMFDAVRSIRERRQKVILLTPQGKRFTQAKARALAKEPCLVLLCGRYEGVDERIAQHLADEELSIGDFVLAGGEAAAAVVLEAVTRLLPGALGNPKSAEEDSFEAGRLDFPHYTRPEKYRGWRVPRVLLSGDHRLVDAWRLKEALKRTRQRRPDLYRKIKN